MLGVAVVLLLWRWHQLVVTAGGAAQAIAKQQAIEVTASPTLGAGARLLSTDPTEN